VRKRAPGMAWRLKRWNLLVAGAAMFVQYAAWSRKAEAQLFFLPTLRVPEYDDQSFSQVRRRFRLGLVAAVEAA
jgi:hypothetical protein